MDANQLLARGDNYVYNEVEGEVVMMNITTGKYASLNETGKAVWLMLEEPKLVRDILKALAATYNVDPAQCEKDVTPFLEKMLTSNALVAV
jgi:hypothetical protein